MRIRPATSADFEAIALLTNGFIRDTAIHFGEVPVTAQELRDDWNASKERYPYLIAEDAEGNSGAGAGADSSRAPFLGYAKAGPWRTRSAYRFTAEVGIYIESHAQRRGIGAALYGALIESCGSAGFHTLIAGITLPNEPSVKFHERLGFIRAAVFPEVGRKFGAWHDVGFWQLMLTPKLTAAPGLARAPAP